MSRADHHRWLRALRLGTRALLVEVDRIAERAEVLDLIEGEGLSVGRIAAQPGQQVWDDAQKTAGDVLVVSGLELLGEVALNDWLAGLNTARDVIFDLEKPIVFLVDDAQHTRIARQCPDFMSRVGLVVESDPPPAAPLAPDPPKPDPGRADAPLAAAWQALGRHDVGPGDALWVDPTPTQRGAIERRMQRAFELHLQTHGGGFLGAVSLVPGTGATLVRRLATAAPWVEGGKVYVPENGFRSWTLLTVLRTVKPGREGSPTVARAEAELRKLLATTLGNSELLDSAAHPPPDEAQAQKLAPLEARIMDLGQAILRGRCVVPPLITFTLHTGTGAHRFLIALADLVAAVPVFSALLLAPRDVGLERTSLLSRLHRHEILPALDVARVQERSFCLQVLQKRGLLAELPALDRLVGYSDGLLDDLLRLAREALLDVEDDRPVLTLGVVESAIRRAQADLRRRLAMVNIDHLRQLDGRRLDDPGLQAASRPARAWIDQRLLTQVEPDGVLRLHRAVAELLDA